MIRYIDVVLSIKKARDKFVMDYVIIISVYRSDGCINVQWNFSLKRNKRKQKLKRYLDYTEIFQKLQPDFKQKYLVYCSVNLCYNVFEL